MIPPSVKNFTCTWSAFVSVTASTARPSGKSPNHSRVTLLGLRTTDIRVCVETEQGADEAPGFLRAEDGAVDVFRQHRPLTCAASIREVVLAAACRYPKIDRS